MNLNLAHKIFGIAIIVLVLMATVAAFSVRLTAKISNELDLLANKQLPLSDTIGELNVRILEQGMLIQRLFSDTVDIPRYLERIEILDGEIEVHFKKAYALFAFEEKNEKHPPETIFKLHNALSHIEAEYRDYEKKGDHLLRLLEEKDEEAFHVHLPDFVALRADVDGEIDVLRHHMETVSDEAVKRADSNEKFLLIFNAGFTILASTLALILSGYVTRVLVRNVRNLVTAAEEVEHGALDVEVPIVTRDEVGRLTKSFNEMVGGLRLKERIKDTFGKYIDPRIVTGLIEDPEFTRFGGDRREMTVMFIDLQGYTTISENLPPDELVHMLNLFLTSMTEAVSANKGVINDFQGDAVMAFWGPPFTGADEHAALACAAARDAIENFERFRADVAAELGAKAGSLDLNMRVGISSGEMIVGNIGSASSRKFSVIGDPVNLGARLEGANKNYGSRIILSERTRTLAGDAAEVRELDLVRVKGKSEPSRIFQMLTTKAATDRFQAGLDAYRNQDWETAEREFGACIEADSTDPVPKAFLERIAFLKAHPPGRDWDGVWTFETK